MTLLVHGWSAGPAVWSKLAEDGDAFPSFRNVESVDGFLEQLTQALASDVVIGWSMGAMLGIELAAALPHRIEALILIGGTPRFENMDRRRGWPARVIRRMQKQLAKAPDTVLEDFSRQMFSPVEESLVDSYLDQFSAPPQRDFSPASLQAGLDYLATRDLTDQLSCIKCPVLWIHGSEDRICPVAALDCLPANHDKQVIPDAGHIPFWTQPETVRRLIKEFLSEVTRK